MQWVFQGLSALAITETVPLSFVLPVMAVAILCVWVTHCSVPAPVREPTPKPPPAIESTPVLESASEPAPAPEVAAPDAEPQETSMSAPELSDCPVTAKEDACELSESPVMAMEAVPELSDCLVMAMKAVREFSPCLVAVAETAVDLSVPVPPDPPWSPAQSAPP